MKSIYLIDSCVLLHDPQCIYKFAEHDVYLILSVIDDLDDMKTKKEGIGWSAREVFRILEQFNLREMTTKGVVVNDKGGRLFVYNVEMPDKTFDSPNITRVNSDNALINASRSLKASNPKRKVIIVSKDMALRVRSEAWKCPAENYRSDLLDEDAYTGIRYVQMDDVDAAEDWNMLWSEPDVDPESLSEKTRKALKNHLAPNEYVIFQWGEEQCPTRFKDGLLHVLKEKSNGQKSGKNKYMGISANNIEQICAIDALADESVALVTLCGAAGTGKAQPLDAKLLTPSGWIEMGDIKKGDFVIGSDGKPKKVLNVYPQGVKEVFKVAFSDNTSTECCKEHLWYTKTSHDRNGHRKGSVKSLLEIQESLFSRPLVGTHKNHSIPMVKPVQFIEQENIIDPYILGALLGDGGFSSRGMIYLSTADEEILEYFNKYLPTEIEIIKCKGDNCDYRIVKKSRQFGKNNNLVKDEIEKMGLLGLKSHEKFIPDKYKWNSVDNRMKLLRGLLDTDGCCSKDGRNVAFYSTSLLLAKDVEFVARSLGCKTSIKPKQTKYTYNGIKKDGKPSYVVNISMNPDINPFTINRKQSRYQPRTKYLPQKYIVDITSVGEKQCQCILVDADDHLYVTDDFIVTHNTLAALAVSLQKVCDGLYDKIVIMKPTMPVGGKDIGALPGDKFEKLSHWFGPYRDNLQLLTGKVDFSLTLEDLIAEGKIEAEAMTYIQGRSIPNSIIIIDESENISPREARMVVERCGKNSRVILLGDLSQVENPYLDARSCGLAHAINGGRWMESCGAVTLKKVERSTLAAIASEIFNQPEARR